MGAVVNRGVKDVFEGYEIFAKYKFDGIKLGAGATCQVHEAVSKAKQENFAVKIIVKEEAEMSGRTLPALLKEKEIMTKLRHPNIIQLSECFEDDVLFYFVMELCEGGTLFEKLEHDIVLEELAAKKMCREMFSAVQHLHDKGFIHRDLRPESWLLSDLSETATLRLTNFRFADYCGKDTSLSQPCGTLHYVAPEVLRSKYGRESDVWTLGVVLFIIMYGSYPFDGDSAALVMKAILSSEPDWSNSCYALSIDVRDFLKQLLHKEPEKRMTIGQGLNHPWLPKEKGSNARLSRRATSEMLSTLKRSSTVGSLMGKQKRRTSLESTMTRQSVGTTASQIKGPSVLGAADSKAQGREQRRPSALVTDDLIKVLEKEACNKKQMKKANDEMAKTLTAPQEQEGAADDSDSEQF